MESLVGLIIGITISAVISGLIIWIVWHVLQISSEKEHHEEARSHFRKNYKE